MTAPTFDTHARSALREALLSLSLDNWRQWASDAAIRRGLDWFRSHRVMDFRLTDTELRASLTPGARGEPAAYVTVSMEDGKPVPFVQHDFRAPPTRDECWAAAVCAVTALQHDNPISDAQLRSSAERLRNERRRRAREGVIVEPVGENATYGVWTARSIDTDRPGRAPYRVQLRALDRPINGCSCPDFATSELGTCKHTEAVVLRAPAALRRRVHPRVVVYTTFAPEKSRGIQVPREYDLWFTQFAGELLDLATDAETGPGGCTRIEWRGIPDDVWFAFVDRLVGVDHVELGPDVLAEQVHRAELALRARRRASVAAEVAELGAQPDFLAVSMHPYQVDGVRHLVTRGRAVLADEMGLGKTLQAIAAMRLLMLRGDVSHTLVVCPTSLMHQWRGEIERFTGLHAEIVEGNAKQRVELLRSRPAIAITSYERVIRDFGEIRNLLRPDLVIADEAQRFKNWQTRVAAHMKALAAPYRFALTGTPLENRLLELYSIVDFVDPDVLGPMWRFMQEFHTLDARGLPIATRNVPELRARIADVLLRRDRSLIADQLPTRQDIRLITPLDAVQRDYHDAAVTIIERMGAIAQTRPLSPDEERRLRAAISRARMACDAAGILDNETPSSPKLALFAELVQELCVDGDRKLVAFSQWIDMGALAQQHAERVGATALQLHGGLTAAVRAAMVTRFREDPTVKVLICSDAGSTGLNLQNASAMVHLDVPWTPAILHQRTARIYRLGQSRPVLVYMLVSTPSYEEHVEGVLRAKEKLFDATLGDAPTDEADDAARNADAADHVNGDEAASASSDSSDSTIDDDITPAWLRAMDTGENTDPDDLTAELDSESSDEGSTETTTLEAIPPATTGEVATAAEASTPPADGAPVSAASATSPSAGVTTQPSQAAPAKAVSDAHKAARNALGVLFRLGNRRTALELLIRSEAVAISLEVGAPPPAAWADLATWWYTHAAAANVVPVERILLLGTATSFLAHPAALDADPEAVSRLWDGLVG